MKKSLLMVALALTVALLTGCAANNQTFPDANTAPANAQRDPLAVPTEAPSLSFDLPEGYDPASEEGGGENYSDGLIYNDLGRALYAGATPIPLDPIDMPTPTPKPTLTFSYGLVTSDKLRLSFEGPVGWGIDESAADAITLINPNELDGTNATLTVRVYSVASSYKLNDVKTDLRNMLKELGQYNFASWKPTNIDSRKIMQKDGFYANYEGVYTNGTAIYGRVMMALLDNNQVIVIHLMCPNGYFNSSYKAVIEHARDTMKQI